MIQGWIKLVATAIWQPENNIRRPLMLKITGIAKAGCHFGNKLFQGTSSPPDNNYLVPAVYKDSQKVIQLTKKKKKAICKTPKSPNDGY